MRSIALTGIVLGRADVWRAQSRRCTSDDVWRRYADQDEDQSPEPRSVAASM
jgi:hypothetical protein